MEEEYRWRYGRLVPPPVPSLLGVDGRPSSEDLLSLSPLARLFMCNIKSLACWLTEHSSRGLLKDQNIMLMKPEENKRCVWPRSKRVIDLKTAKL